MLFGFHVLKANFYNLPELLNLFKLQYFDKKNLEILSNLFEFIIFTFDIWLFLNYFSFKKGIFHTTKIS